MSKLKAALKRKFKTPKACLRALGLDESLLDVRHLAFDSAATDPNAAVVQSKVRRLFEKHFGEGHPAMEQALSLLESEAETGAIWKELDLIIVENLSAGAREEAMVELESAMSDLDVVEDENEEEMRRRIARMEEILRREGIADDEIEELRPKAENYVRGLLREERRRRGNGVDRDLPRSAVNGGMGGRINEDRRRRRMARDEARAYQIFPEAQRIRSDTSAADHTASAMRQSTQAYDAWDLMEAFGANRIKNDAGHGI